MEFCVNFSEYFNSYSKEESPFSCDETSQSQLYWTILIERGRQNFYVSDTVHNLCDVGTLNVVTLLIVSAVYSLYGLY